MKYIRLYSYLQSKGFSVILSDMCPPISGITVRDATLSIELGMRALEFALGEAVVNQPFQDDGVIEANDDGMLQPGGNLLIKLLESQDIQGENSLKLKTKRSLIVLN